MPYKGADADQKNIIEFARGGAPQLSVRDEILQKLEELAAEIKADRMDPSHLIIGFGERLKQGTAYEWDAVGLDTVEVIGHLQTYATRLALGEGE